MVPYSCLTHASSTSTCAWRGHPCACGGGVGGGATASKNAPAGFPEAWRGILLLGPVSDLLDLGRRRSPLAPFGWSTLNLSTLSCAIAAEPLSRVAFVLATCSAKEETVPRSLASNISFWPPARVSSSPSFRYQSNWSS